MIIIMLILFIGIILFPTISFNGAMTGLTLWAVKVLPALFPAMLITACMMQLLPAASKYAYIYIVTCGIFCGFPNGAFACAQYHINNPKEKICEKIFGYCNISGTAFVINYIYHNFLYRFIGLIPLLIIIYTPPLSMLFVTFIRNRKYLTLKAVKSTKSDECKLYFSEIFRRAVDTAVENALKLGGYIVFFSCLSAYCIHIFSSNSFWGFIISGLIEITNATALTAQSMENKKLAIIFITAFNAFGGISTIMQTLSVIAGSGLSIKKYIYQKFICTLFTVGLSIFLIYVLL